MGIFLGLVNFDQEFNQKAVQPLVINDIAENSGTDKENLNRIIYTRFYTDLLSNLPSCECGAVVGEYNLGVMCRQCNMPVISPMEQKLESLLWLRAPKDVEALMNPIVWTIVSQRFTSSSFEVIRYLCDVNYKPSVKTPDVLESVLALGIPRSYNNFVRNFDTIMAELFRMKGFKGRRDGQDPLQIMLREYRDCVFSKYLPVPNRALLVVEQNPTGIYVDPTITGAVDAIRTMAGIDTPLSSHTARTRENRAIKTIIGLAAFYGDLTRTKLAKKSGIFRKHVYGTRSHFCFRTVISSLTEPHSYDELHIPWGVGVSLFRVHLMSKLLRRGMAPNEAAAYLNKFSQAFDPLVNELMIELINESPHRTAGFLFDDAGSLDKNNELVVEKIHDEASTNPNAEVLQWVKGKPGIPVVFQRNPSLERGSAQAMFVTHVKTDVTIPTTSLSILSVVGFNADFDGKLNCCRKTFLIAGNSLEPRHQSGARKCKRQGLKTTKIGQSAAKPL